MDIKRDADVTMKRMIDKYFGLTAMSVRVNAIKTKIGLWLKPSDHKKRHKYLRELLLVHKPLRMILADLLDDPIRYTRVLFTLE